MDSRAVSPLIGFVLLLMILMTLLGIAQSHWVPEWNRQVEAKHLDKLSYEVAELSEAVSLAASTGNPAKVVLDAGVSYPNYYVLISPAKASTTVTSVELFVNITGNVKLGSRTKSINRELTTHAIVVEPNYLYSSRMKLIYEHSVVFREENSVIVNTSDQNSFSPSKVSLSIVDATFGGFATTDEITLIFHPASYGGEVWFDGSLRFESYDEKTAEWWVSRLRDIYGPDNVTKSGRNVTVNFAGWLSIDYVFATQSVTPRYEQIPTYLMPLLNDSTTYTLTVGETKDFGVKVLDEFFNPLKSVDPSDVQINTSGDCVNYTNDGEVWCSFSAASSGSYQVNFSISEDEYVVYQVEVQQSSSGGGTAILPVYNVLLTRGLINIYHGPLDGVIDENNPPLQSPEEIIKNDKWEQYSEDDKTLVAYDDGEYLNDTQDAISKKKKKQEKQEENHAAQLFEFNVGDVQISGLRILWNGIAWLDVQNDRNDGVVVYLWNGSGWEYLCGTTSSSEVWLECENSGNYVVDGKVYVLLVQDNWVDTWKNKTSQICTDYIELNLLT